MKIYIGRIIVVTIFSFILAGCGGGDGAQPDVPEIDPDVPEIDFIDLTSNKGFSSTYLSNKTFYRPQNYQSNNFIETRMYTNSTVTLSDNLFNNNYNAPYSIVSSNGIDGVIQYNDGVYGLHYNVISIESDHIKVCYTYTGIDTVIACDIAQSISWYFDLAIAENNYP